MNDSNPFEEFINGLDLPEPDGNPADDAKAAADELAERIRTTVRAMVKWATEQQTIEWDAHLNVIQLFVRNELLNCVGPRPGAFENMTKEEVAMNAGYTMITLAWMIYDEVTRTLDDRASF